MQHEIIELPRLGRQATHATLRTKGRGITHVELFRPPTRSISSSLPSRLSASRVIVQTLFLLIASRKTVPEAFGPLTVKLSAACPVPSATTLIEPLGNSPGVIGVPRTATAAGLASTFARAS